jgi:hypothetical protein
MEVSSPYSRSGSLPRSSSVPETPRSSLPPPGPFVDLLVKNLGLSAAQSADLHGLIKVRCKSSSMVSMFCQISFPLARVCRLVTWRPALTPLLTRSDASHRQHTRENNAKGQFNNGDTKGCQECARERSHSACNYQGMHFLYLG